MPGLSLSNPAFVGSLSGLSTSSAAPASANMALVTTSGSQGLLASNRATGFNLTTNWRLKVRLRQATTNGQYVLGMTPDAGAIELIWNFQAGIYEMYGANDRFGLNKAVTDGLYHTLEFTYSGGVISGFLDGVAAGTKTSSFFTSNVTANPPFAIGTVAGNTAFLGGYDYIILDIDGVNVVNLNFNEASGPATNTGSNGGVMNFTGTVSREAA